MKTCPTCAREIADSASVCDACEAWAAALVLAHPADDEARASTASTPSLTPPVAAATVAPAISAVTTAAPGTAAAATAAPAAAFGSRRNLALAAAAIGAVALTGFAISARSGSPPEASPTATAPAAHVTPAATSAPAAAAAPAVQTWSTENQAAWLDNPRRGAAFELSSENVVKTWLGPVRPSLVVRCTSQQIEAFVVTGTPLKIDPRVQGKAVTISVDGEPLRTEHWVDSERHTSVFAPDPAAFTARLRTARMLSFGYSPHNSSDVVAQFHVAGIDALIGAAAKHCRAAK